MKLQDYYVEHPLPMIDTLQKEKCLAGRDGAVNKVYKAITTKHERKVNSKKWNNYGFKGKAFIRPANG